MGDYMKTIIVWKCPDCGSVNAINVDMLPSEKNIGFYAADSIKFVCEKCTQTECPF